MKISGICRVRDYPAIARLSIQSHCEYPGENRFSTFHAHTQSHIVQFAGIHFPSTPSELSHSAAQKPDETVAQVSGHRKSSRFPHWALCGRENCGFPEVTLHFAACRRRTFLHLSVAPFENGRRPPEVWSPGKADIVRTLAPIWFPHWPA